MNFKLKTVPGFKDAILSLVDLLLSRIDNRQRKKIMPSGFILF